MKMLLATGAMALAVTLAACSEPAAPAKPAAPPSVAAAPPAPAPIVPEPLVLKFSGVLPCADCPGIATELTLTRKAAGWAEGTYRLKETYIERGGPPVATGQWTTLRGDATDDDATVYELNPDQPDQARHFLRVGDDAAVRALTRDLKTWPAGLPDTLKRVK